MPTVIQNVAVDCRDPYRVASFWSAVLDRPIEEPFSETDDDVVVPLDGSCLYFQRVPEPKAVKNRLHLCLRPEIPRDRETERLIGLGATLVEDHRTDDGAGWVVLADIEGNEFCVLRSTAERSA